MARMNQNLSGIGSTICDLSRSLADQLEALKYPEPSFASDAPASLPLDPNLQGTRMQLLETLEVLRHLVTGPSDFWFHESMFPNHVLLMFDVFNNFDFWNAIPLNGSASYADIARLTKLPEQTVRRFLRLAFTIFVFAEESPGSERIVHTAASAHVVRSPFVQSFIAHNMEDIRPAATVGVDALKRWYVGHSDPPEEITNCAVALATDGGRQRGTDLWKYLENYERADQPKGFRAKRFADAMQAFGETSGIMTETVLKQFDWDSLNEATVVDLGGSAGHISAILAEKYPKLDIVVQDLAAVSSAFNANIKSSPYASRIKFQSHDFFDTQRFPADVFLLKSVLHDWPDKYVVRIIRNLVHVLRSGNHLLILDLVVPADHDKESDSTTPLSVRKSIAAMDLQMHVACNSRERALDDWTRIIEQADVRFELKGVHTPVGSPLGLLDFVFQG